LVFWAAYEMASGSGVTIQLDSKAIPVLDGAVELAEMGIIPAGAYRNMDYVKGHLRVAAGVRQVFVDLIADPQSSGGLLISLPADEAADLVERLEGVTTCSAIVGRILPDQGCSVEII